jgi:hypothetical protein
MKKHSVLFLVLLMMTPLPQVARAWGEKDPTAIVIDAETGKPIEGAIALAQWHQSAGGSIEGASEALAKAKEAYSDKDGKIYIDGYWGMNIFSKAPTLTVYKPGYVLWNSKEICPMFEKRKDFDDKNRTVKLLKFDTEAPKWAEKYPNEGGPRSLQKLFFNGCYDSGIGRKYLNKEITIREIFFKYELLFIDKEEMDRREKLKLR